MSESGREARERLGISPMTQEELDSYLGQKSPVWISEEALTAADVERLRAEAERSLDWPGVVKSYSRLLEACVGQLARYEQMTEGME